MNPDFLAKLLAALGGTTPPPTPKTGPGSIYAALGLTPAPLDDAAVRPSAGVQMMQTGITPERRGAFQGDLSRALYNVVEPREYAAGWHDIRQQGAKLLGQFAAPTPDTTAPSAMFKPGLRTQQPAPQEDSWRLYLGLPQQSNSLGVSQYRPGNSSAGGEYYKVNNFFPALLKQQDTGPSPVRALVERVQSAPNGRLPLNDDLMPYGAPAGVMRNFQLTHGRDATGPYLAYYDKWDLHTPGAEAVGKPYEIYDRLYYNPHTYAPLPEADVLAKKAGLNLTPAQP